MVVNNVVGRTWQHVMVTQITVGDVVQDKGIVLKIEAWRAIEVTEPGRVALTCGVPPAHTRTVYEEHQQVFAFTTGVPTA